MSWKGVVTDNGKAMLNEFALGSTTLSFTSVKLGSGLTEAVDMRAATGLKSYVTDGEYESISPAIGGAKICIEVGPHTTAYTLHEVGLYAKLSNQQSPSLFALIQDDGNGIPVPATADFPDFIFRLANLFPISNLDSVSITVDPSAYVAKQEYEASEVRELLMAEGLPNCRATPSFDSNGNITGLTHTSLIDSETIRTDVFTRASGSIVETRTLNTGEVLTITIDLTNKTTDYVFS